MVTPIRDLIRVDSILLDRMTNSLELTGALHLATETSGYLPSFLAGVVAGAIVVTWIGNTGSKKGLLVTRRNYRGGRKLSQSNEEVVPDSDIKSLKKIHSILDVIERDIVPLTCRAACGGKGGNLVRFLTLHSISARRLIILTDPDER